MFDWLAALLASQAFTWRNVIVGAAVFLGVLAATVAVIVVVLIRLPPSYFHPRHDRRFLHGRHWLVRGIGIFGKNLAGFVLVALGFVLFLPGVPGPGLVVLLVGSMLVDFPGKRALEYKVISQPRVLRKINQLRAKFSAPPFVLE